MISYHYDTIDSTNDQAKRLIDRHRGRRLLVSAGMQTAGRGRSGRSWRSPVGGAWFSVAWPTDSPQDRYDCLPVLVGWSVLQAVGQAVGRGHRLEIKWPNDVLLNGRKVAGVLCERVASAQPATGVSATLIIGVGINANFNADRLGGEGLRYPATSVRHEMGQDVDLHSLVTRCVAGIHETMSALDQALFDPSVFSSIHRRLAWIGEVITLRVGGRDVVGVCQGLDVKGRLRLMVGGQEQIHHAGEVGRLTLMKGGRTAPAAV